MKKNSFVLLFFASFLISGKSFGQNLDASVYTKEAVYTLTAGSTSSSNTFQFDKGLHFPGYPAKTLRYARTYVEVLPLAMPLPTAGSLTGSIIINGRNAVGSNQTIFDNVSNPQTQTYTLNITPTNPSATVYNDFSAQYTGSAPALTAMIISTTHTNSLGVDMQIKVRLEVAYNLNVNENTILQIPLNVASVKPALNAVAPRVARFKWKTEGRYYPAYQLQILRLYNKYSGSVEPACSTTVEWNKAVSVNIESDLMNTLDASGFINYDYTLAEGTGFYVWRVRPVGNAATGGFANSANYGNNWSVAITEGTGINLTNPNSTPDGYFYFSDPDADKNWIYSRVFTEKTNIRESILYAGYLLHKKQTQTYLPSKRATILMQYVMDYMGRPAITTLPVPQQNLIGLTSYKTKFVQNSAGNLFRNTDFDSDAALAAASNSIRIRSVNGFEYYSNNPDKSIPNSMISSSDQSGFPYSRTVFENTTNSRITDQSGVGPYHYIGSGHTTKTLYATASDQELIRLLGDEAPRGSNVLKTTSIDPNNTASVSYTDLNGKVIATCLRFNEGDIANNITNPDDVMTSFTVNEVMNNNIQVSDGLISTKRISFTEDNTPLTISYEFACPDLVAMCGTVGDNGCRYKLIVIIHEVVNPANRLEAEVLIDMKNISCTDGKFQIALPASEFSYMEQSGTPPPASPLTLDRGDYIIEKRLVFDRSNNAAVADIALQSIKSRVEGFAKTIVNSLQSIETLAEYNTFISNYLCQRVVPTNCTGNPVTCTFQMTPGMVSSNQCISGYNESNGEIQISILPVDPNVPQIRQLKLESQCCDFTVPVEFIPPLECPANPTAPADYQVFYNYTVKFLEAKGLAKNGNANYFLSQGANLWGNYENQTNASNDLKHMVYHMVHDSYAQNSASAAATQYTCENLADCWTAALNTVTEAQMNTIEDNNTNAGDDLDVNDLFDDMPGGGILKLFMGKKKKNKIKAQITAQLSGLGSMTFGGPSLMEAFFDCAGKKYASVITEFNSPLPDLFGSTTCANSILSPEVSLYNDVNDTDHKTFWRIYQFKYVNYYIDGLAFKRQYNCEATSCFCPVVQNTPCSTTTPVCYDDDAVEYAKCNTSKTHHDWTFAERNTFAQCIENRSSNNFPTILTNDQDELDSYTCSQLVGESNPEFMRWEDLETELNGIEAGCENACEEHRAQFTQKVRELFTSHCYNIVATSCDLGPEDVPEDHIVLIVDQMVAQCKSMCDIEYLAGLNINCIQCENSGLPRTYVQVIMGSAREKLLVNLAKQGNVELEIRSMCTGHQNDPPVSCNGLDPQPGATSGFTPACGKDYNTSQNAKSDFCAPQTFNPTTNPCPLDQLDANGATQPVKIHVRVE